MVDPFGFMRVMFWALFFGLLGDLTVKVGLQISYALRWGVDL